MLKQLQGESSQPYREGMRAVFQCIFVKHGAKALVLDGEKLAELLQCVSLLVLWSTVRCSQLVVLVMFCAVAFSAMMPLYNTASGLDQQTQDSVLQAVRHACSSSN